MKPFPHGIIGCPPTHWYNLPVENRRSQGDPRLMSGRLSVTAAEAAVP